MRLLDLTLPTPAETLALDEALLLRAEAGDGYEVLRFWEWPKPAVILGAGCRLADDVDEAACRRDGVPILRRASGGGTVLLGSGCLCYTLILAHERAADLQEIRSSYTFILERLRDSLDGILPGITCAGTSDLAVGNLKFSGNAQQRKRRHLLHHGTILYGFDLRKIGEYLRQPTRQPAYRDRRAHEEFLTNLPVEVEEIQTRLRAAWGADNGFSAWPVATVRELVAEKYTKQEWIRRR